MFKALSGGLTLAVTVIVLKLFLPEIAVSLIDLIVKVIDVMIISVDQASLNLPH
jgi:hypothetical protein